MERRDSPVDCHQLHGKTRRPTLQDWKTFLGNHPVDLLMVRTAISLAILHHGRRRLVTIKVTSTPTAEWIAVLSLRR